MLQGCGLAFLFVPINTVAYSYLPPEKNNAASGLINLARNVGASVGISFVTTMLDRRTQFHRSRLSAHLDPGEPERAGDAARHHAPRCRRTERLPGAPCSRRMGCCRELVERQSEMLAYIDNFRMLALVTLLLIPAVLLVRKPKRGGGPAPVH